MVKTIRLQDLIYYIEGTLENNERSTIHIYDYNKPEGVFDVTIEPFEKERIEYLQIEKTKDNTYDKIFDSIRNIKKEETQIHASNNILYGLSIHIMIKSNVHVVIEFYYEEGIKWMKKTYEKYKTKK